jgi:hypothetical protein
MATKYINPQIPDFELPEYRGELYEATVPDTLDIAERARLALNALTETTDPEADYEVYWIVVFRSNPPHMFHSCWQSTATGKFMMAASFMRLMTGSEQNLHVDRRWMEVALKSQGPDGLNYVPLVGRPWAFVWSPVEPEEAKRRSEFKDQLLSAMGNSTMLSTMSHFAKRDGSAIWRQAVRRAVDGMINLAVDEGELAYFWPSFCFSVKDQPDYARMPTDPFEAETSIAPHGLVHAYQVLGYEPALTMARKIINYLRHNFYAPDGSFIASPGVPSRAHFHAHTRGLLAMQEYAETADDDELMGFVVQSYEKARDLLTNQILETGLRVVKTPGASLIGFFPEWANSHMGEKGETCQLSDMIAVALRLSEAGVGDYWDDADRWIRNHLAEAQLTNIDWIGRLPQDLAVEPHGTTERVPERNVGAFAGGPDPNDWYAGAHAHVLGHCCTANGSKVLYWIWERILRYQDGKLRVNLLLNRASKWADVDSYIPYQGRVDVKVKQGVDLSIRIPEWVTPAETHCKVNDKDRSLEWEGRYAKVGSVKPGDVVILTFPIFKQTDHAHIEKQPYTLVRKGNEVISIDPPGRYYPLYQRQHYSDDAPRWRRITRFISDEIINW